MHCDFTLTFIVYRMASDIISCLQLDKNAPGRIILIKEINGCDSAFIYSCVLSHCIKNQTPIVFISMHNSLNHHLNVGLKMNFNLQKHIDSGLIQFYNLGEEIVLNLLENVTFSIQELYLKVQHKIPSRSTEPLNIIVDGLSHFFDLGYTLRDVNIFCKQLYGLVRQSNNSFLLIHCNQANEDDVTHTMSNLLMHKADTVVEIENLQSGWSADVSGLLTVKYLGQKFQYEHMFNLDRKPTRYLFKLFDRGVKLLAPGTV